MPQIHNIRSPNESAQRRQRYQQMLSKAWTLFWNVGVWWRQWRNCGAGSGKREFQHHTYSIAIYDSWILLQSDENNWTNKPTIFTILQCTANLMNRKTSLPNCKNSTFRNFSMAKSRYHTKPRFNSNSATNDWHLDMAAQDTHLPAKFLHKTKLLVAKRWPLLGERVNRIKRD